MHHIISQYIIIHFIINTEQISINELPWITYKKAPLLWTIINSDGTIQLRPEIFSCTNMASISNFQEIQCKFIPFFCSGSRNILTGCLIFEIYFLNHIWIYNILLSQSKNQMIVFWCRYTRGFFDYLIRKWMLQNELCTH